MNTKAFLPCGGGSNVILGTGRENQIFVYQMGRLCKISGIPAPFCLCGSVVGGFMGWVVKGFMGWVVVWVVGGFMGWVGGGGVGGLRVHGLGWWVVVGWVVGGFMGWVGVGGWSEGSCGGWVVRWLVGGFMEWVVCL